MRCKELIQGLLKEESGQDLLEYALVLATVLAAAIVGSASIATLITSGVTEIFAKILSIVS